MQNNAQLGSVVPISAFKVLDKVEGRSILCFDAFLRDWVGLVKAVSTCMNVDVESLLRRKHRQPRDLKLARSVLIHAFNKLSDMGELANIYWLARNMDRTVRVIRRILCEESVAESLLEKVYFSLVLKREAVTDEDIFKVLGASKG